MFLLTHSDTKHATEPYEPGSGLRLNLCARIYSVRTRADSVLQTRISTRTRLQFKHSHFCNRVCAWSETPSEDDPLPSHGNAQIHGEGAGGIWESCSGSTHPAAVGSTQNAPEPASSPYKGHLPPSEQLGCCDKQAQALLF